MFPKRRQKHPSQGRRAKLTLRPVKKIWLGEIVHLRQSLGGPQRVEPLTFASRTSSDAAERKPVFVQRRLKENDIAASHQANPEVHVVVLATRRL